MKRRTLLGSAAMTFGGASLLGTNAFTSVKAERSISVDVQGDQNAFLKLAQCHEDSDVEIDHDESIDSRDFDPSNVVDDDDGDVSIDLTESNPDLDGSGITNNAVWRFPKALRISNAGSQPVCVDFQLVNTDGKSPRAGLNEGEKVNIDIDADENHEKTISSEDPAVVFYSGDSSENRFSWNKLDTGSENAIHLEPSGSECIGFNIRTFGFNHDSAQLKGLTLRIRADTNAGCAEDEDEDEDE